jgi:hypothetical protein
VLNSFESSGAVPPAHSVKTAARHACDRPDVVGTIRNRSWRPANRIMRNLGSSGSMLHVDERRFVDGQGPWDAFPGWRSSLFLRTCLTIVGLWSSPVR